MTFKAKYISKTAGSYYLTIRADSINEATKLAERQTRKDFQLVTIKEYNNGLN